MESLDEISHVVVKEPGWLCADRAGWPAASRTVFPVLGVTFALRGLGLGFLRRAEAQGFARRARPGHADGLHVDDIVRLFLQVP